MPFSGHCPSSHVSPGRPTSPDHRGEAGALHGPPLLFLKLPTLSIFPRARWPFGSSPVKMGRRPVCSAACLVPQPTEKRCGLHTPLCPPDRHLGILKIEVGFHVQTQGEQGLGGDRRGPEQPAHAHTPPLCTAHVVNVDRWETVSGSKQGDKSPRGPSSNLQDPTQM